MTYVVRTGDDYLRKGCARVGMLPPETESPSWMHILKGFHERTRRPVQITSFYPDKSDATRFPSIDEAWRALDKAGVGRREDFLVTPYE